MNVTQAALGTKKIQKGKIAKSESKTLQKVAKSREYTERKDLFWLSTALAAPEKAGKVVHVCGCFFGAKVSKATSRRVCSQKRYVWSSVLFRNERRCLPLWKFVIEREGQSEIISFALKLLNSAINSRYAGPLCLI